MRKGRIILSLLTAVILIAACSRVQIDRPDSEICFQVAEGGVTLTKAEDYKADYGSVPFGAYSWFRDQNTQESTSFMTNQKVSYYPQNNVWAPETIYYWPRGGSLDFICYSPYEADGPQVSEESITFTDITVGTVDILYADKQTGLTCNTNTYYYNGVPVLFRHALAKVGFTLRLAYSEAYPETGDKTKWEVILNSATLKDIHTTGNLSLVLDESGAWKLPDSNTWTSNGTTTDYVLDCGAIEPFTSTNAQEIGNSIFVLPQTLDQGQKLVLCFTIKTWRDTGNGYPEEPVITETHVAIDAGLATGALQCWGINQSIRYNLIMAPSMSGTGQSPLDIHFDPSTAGWDNVTLSTVLHF